jgi:hypothetical protein
VPLAKVAAPVAAPLPAPVPEAPAPAPVIEKPKPQSTANLASVGFASQSINVSRRNVLAALRVARSGPVDARLSVRWALVSGSAQPNRDFKGPIAGRAELHEGQTATTIFVPLADNGAATPGSAFSLRLVAINGPGKLGSNSTVTVNIVN